MRRILITGASSGIGLAAAHLFLARGWKVLMADIKENKSVLEKFDDMYENRFFFYRCDIGKNEDVKRLFYYSMDKMNGIDSIINNAGILIPGELHEIEEDDWNKLFDTDVKSIFLTSKYFVPYMIKNGGGTIVNTASISGLFGDYAMALYNAAKGAVVNLTRAMAVDYGKYSIRVNSVCPGAIDTPLLQDSSENFIKKYNESDPMKRIGVSDEVAKAMYFLASDESSYCSGVNLPVTGGLDSWTGQPAH